MKGYSNEYIKMKKTLVVHPYDETTLELEEVYRGKPVDILHRADITRADVEDAIAMGGYRRVILLGHGTPLGLCNMKTNSYIFDHGTYKNYTHARSIELVAVWCNANQFFMKVDEPDDVFSTGMFVSELREAKDYFLNKATEQEIHDQFLLFSKVLNTAAFLPINKIKEYIDENYIGEDEVTKFNRAQMELG